MNVYGYIPPSHFPSHSTLTYWAHAASFAGLPSSDSTLASAGLVLGLKKSQLPLLSGEDFTLKGSNSTSPSAEDDFPSLFRVTSSLTSHDPLGGLAHGSIQFHAHIHHQQQHLRKQQQQQQQQHHHHHRPVFSTSPSLGSGIAPLQALCDSDVSAFSTKTLGTSSGSASSSDAKGNLKFGMSRILSDDFGKSRSEKGKPLVFPEDAAPYCQRRDCNSVESSSTFGLWRIIRTEEIVSVISGRKYGAATIFDSQSGSHKRASQKGPLPGFCRWLRYNVTTDRYKDCHAKDEKGLLFPVLDDYCYV